MSAGGHRKIARAVALSLAIAGRAIANQPAAALSNAQIAEAISLGQQCGELPIVKVGSVGGDFEVYIESPFARVALFASLARQMHQPFGPSTVTLQMSAPVFHVWLQYVPTARLAVSVDRVVLQSSGSAESKDGGSRSVIHPLNGHPFELTLGHVPAHGIITELRWRQFEWTFDRLPRQDFDAIVETSAGLQRYRVTAADRTKRMRGCT